jgi:hypothetical protein
MPGRAARSRSAWFNPAFLALLLREVVVGYEEESSRPLPLPLAFIALPIVLHRPTRQALPRGITTSVPVWLQEHQLLRQGFAARARASAPAIREALAVAFSTVLLRLGDGELVVGDAPGRARRATPDTRAITTRARFVGRWLSRAGDVPTIYLLWGVRP